LSLGRALAAGDDGAGVAHALAGRGGGAGDEARDRLLHVGLDVLGGALLGAAADLADHDDAVGVGSALKSSRHVDEVGAVDRVAADADAGALADAERGELTHGLVGERARARHDADLARLVDVPGMMPILHWPGVMTPGQLGPTRRDVEPALERAAHLDHVDDRDALGDADDERRCPRRRPRGSRRPRRAAARR
jgi:hypothetical protein